MASPSQVTTTAIATDNSTPRAGRAVSRDAAAAGATSRANTSRLPVTWLAPAAATPSSTRNAVESRRTGKPRARATSGSTVAKSSGRAMAASTARQGSPTTASTMT